TRRSSDLAPPRPSPYRRSPDSVSRPLFPRPRRQLSYLHLCTLLPQLFEMGSAYEPARARRVSVQIYLYPCRKCAPEYVWRSDLPPNRRVRHLEPSPRRRIADDRTVRSSKTRRWCPSFRLTWLARFRFFPRPLDLSTGQRRRPHH